MEHWQMKVLKYNTQTKFKLGEGKEAGNLQANI